jgi:2'-5' RNA ligase superfamily
LRRRHDWSFRAGVRAHITVLAPFLPPENIGRQTMDTLAALLSSRPPLRFRLTRVERLDRLVYLTPEPVAPFERLTAVVRREWPEVPSFGGSFDRPLYHLTIARDGRLYKSIKDEVSGSLPIAAIAREALLLETHSDHVRTPRRFPLGVQPG